LRLINGPVTGVVVCSGPDDFCTVEELLCFRMV
jgi:hypothetical protein